MVNEDDKDGEYHSEEGWKDAYDVESLTYIVFVALVSEQKRLPNDPKDVAEQEERLDQRNP